MNCFISNDDSVMQRSIKNKCLVVNAQEARSVSGYCKRTLRSSAGDLSKEFQRIDSSNFRVVPYGTANTKWSTSLTEMCNEHQLHAFIERGNRMEGLTITEPSMIAPAPDSERSK